MKKRVASNYIYSSFYQLFLLIVPFVTAPYLARTLLPSGVGINSYVSAVVQIFSLIGLIGLNNYSIREIAYVRSDNKKLTKTFWELILLRLICFIITSIIYILFSLMSEYKIYFLIQFIAIFSSFLDISWFYAGLEEFKVTVTRSFIVKILNVASIFLFIKQPKDLCLFMFISTIYTVIGNSILYFGVKKKLIKRSEIKNISMKKHIIPTIKLFLPQIASLIYLQVDKIMIKLLYDNISSVGFYDQAERIVKMPLALITALSTVMLPRVAHEFKKNNTETVKKYINTSFKFSLILSIPLVFGLIVISKTMIPWFLGNDYSNVISIMSILSFLVFFNSLSSVSGAQYLTAVNNTKILTISYVVSAICNLIINYLTIPKLGACGAGIGTVIAEMVVFMIQFIFILDVVYKKELLISFIKYFICGAVMFAVCYLLGNYFGATIYSTLIQIITGVIVYFGCLFIIKDKYFIELFHKGLDYIKRIKEKLTLKKVGDKI